MTEVVAALIRENGRFLICQCPAHKVRWLLWEFAGGKVESGEIPERALVRKCREELAAMLSVGDVFIDVVHTLFGSDAVPCANPGGRAPVAGAQQPLPDHTG